MNATLAAGSGTASNPNPNLIADPDSLLLWILAATAAVAFPVLLAFNLPPSATFLNQALSLAGWGAWLVMLANSQQGRVALRDPGLRALQGAFGLLILAALSAPLWTGQPWSLALSGAGLLGAALLCTLTAAGLRVRGRGEQAFQALCFGLMVAGLASSLIGILQVFAPTLTDGEFVAHTYILGRAVGNMRQPNHLSSLLLWAFVAVVWLGQSGKLRAAVSVGLGVLFLFVIVLSGSRTGAISTVLLALWGLFDRRLPRWARWLLGSAPLVYAGFWYGTSAWADLSHHVFGGEGRFSTKGDISSSRYGIWKNTLSLIGMHPWLGVGFGEFNLAWTLTPFPDRPVAFFDHTHNLLLQFAVEMGVPAMLVLAGLFGVGLWQAVVHAIAPGDAGASGEAGAADIALRRAALAMVILILVHSQLEYPLWYAYYLLPAAFAFGLCVVRPASIPAVPPSGDDTPVLRLPLVGAILLFLVAVASVVDYSRVVVIFAPPANASPLVQRIAEGRRSVFFSHQGDYAAATTAARPSEVLSAFRGAPHYLLDARLLQTWAVALNEAGDTDHARYLAQRLREFHNEQSRPFFEPCMPGAGDDANGNDSFATGAAELPFQCVPPEREYRFEDFR